MPRNDLYSPYNIARKIAKRLSLYKGTGKAEYKYVHPNGRQFVIHQSTDYLYLYELKPNGMLLASHAQVALRDERLDQLLDKPNSFVRSVAKLGIDPAHIIREGETITEATMFYLTLEQIADEISQSFANNLWYCPTKGALRTQSLEITNALLAVSCEEENSTEHNLRDLSLCTQPDLFKGIYNQNGPLNRFEREKILSYMNKQSNSSWMEIFSMMVRNHETIWQLWISLDPSAPRIYPPSGTWPRIPSKDVFMKILSMARSDRLSKPLCKN